MPATDPSETVRVDVPGVGVCTNWPPDAEVSWVALLEVLWLSGVLVLVVCVGVAFVEVEVLWFSGVLVLVVCVGVALVEVEVLCDSGVLVLVEVDVSLVEVEVL